MRLLTLLCLLAAPEQSTARESIIWAVGDQPPRITFDKHTLGGQGGLQQLMLSNALENEYNAIYMQMTWSRFESDVKKQRNICSSFMLKTVKREKYIRYSIPWHINLPHHVVMHKSKWNNIGRPSIISLNRLIKHNDMIGIVEQSRSYGELDKILNSKLPSNITTASIHPMRALSMLDRNRVDYTIEYPYFANHFMKSNKLDLNSFAIIPISESKPYYYTHVGCPDTAWGRRVIDKVNSVIRTTRKNEDYLSVLTMLYTRDIDKQLIKEIYFNDFIHSN